MLKLRRSGGHCPLKRVCCYEGLKRDLCGNCTRKVGTQASTLSCPCYGDVNDLSVEISSNLQRGNKLRAFARMNPG
jgi:hypothetical protein